MKAKPRIIVITGAESTGKSALTHRLGEHFHCPWNEEYAREYLEKNGPGYTQCDVEKIARQQEIEYLQALRQTTPYVFFDTWLIITKVWFEVVYGISPVWISDLLRNASIDLFLLCDTDLPWIPDPLRENGGEMRRKLQERYRENLEKFGFRYCLVTGQGEQRFQNALHFIRETL